MTAAERALFDLQPLASRVYGLLEEAIPVAMRFFEDNGIKKENGEPRLDPHLFPHIIRWYVCKLLRDAEYDASLRFERDGETTSPDIKTMAMSGLEIRFRGRTLKLWKSRKGGLPLPGRSESRRAFLQENRVLFGNDVSDFYNARNLVFLWDVDDTGDVSLELVCPMPSDFETDDVSDWKYPQLWSIAVPHAATLIQSSPTVFSDRDDADYGQEFGRNDEATENEAEGEE